METDKSGIVEAFIMDPVARPVGVVMWQVLTFPNKKELLIGSQSVHVDLLKSLAEPWAIKTDFVTLPWITVDGLTVRVKLKSLKPILDKHFV